MVVHRALRRAGGAARPDDARRVRRRQTRRVGERLGVERRLQVGDGQHATRVDPVRHPRTVPEDGYPRLCPGEDARLLLRAEPQVHRRRDRARSQRTGVTGRELDRRGHEQHDHVARPDARVDEGRRETVRSLVQPSVGDTLGPVDVRVAVADAPPRPRRNRSPTSGVDVTAATVCRPDGTGRRLTARRSPVQGMVPAQAGKTREGPIAGEPGGARLDRQRSKVGIREVVPMRFDGSAQLREQAPMSCSGRDHHGGRRVSNCLGEGRARRGGGSAPERHVGA